MMGGTCTLDRHGRCHHIHANLGSWCFHSDHARKPKPAGMAGCLLLFGDESIAPIGLGCLGCSSVKHQSARVGMAEIR